MHNLSLTSRLTYNRPSTDDLINICLKHQERNKRLFQNYVNVVVPKAITLHKKTK